MEEVAEFTELCEPVPPNACPLSRLIKNAIVCWNYLYLSQVIANEADPQRREELLETVRRGSVAALQHLNLHGEYDFSDAKMMDSVGLELTPKNTALSPV